MKRLLLRPFMFCVLLILANSLSAQNRIVTGSVISGQDGQPLSGVSIAVTGTKTGTITDDSGNFSISVSGANAKLQIVHVGYLPQTISVGSNASLQISLAIDVSQLGEVVVVGYGTANRKTLTTAVGSIKAEQLASLPITNIADAFTGRLSGVSAISGKGAPGSAPILRIRGYGSINAGSEPLYVIDGMISNAAQFGALDPTSVETVDVLKDAAAGAIYGSRAGNGVVVVTTKKGKTGKTKFAYNVNAGAQQLSKKVKLLNTDEFLQYAKEGYENDNQPVPAWYNQTFPNTDWQDAIFKTAPFQNHQLSVSGGTDKVKYYLSGNILDNQGIAITTYYKRYAVNGSLSIDVNPKLKVGLTFNAANIKQRVNNNMANAGHGSGAYGVSGGIMEQMIWFLPIIPVYLDNGEYGAYTNGQLEGNQGWVGYGNPVANLKETKDIVSSNNAMGRAFLNYEIIDGLTFNTSVTGSVYSTYRNYYVSPYLEGAGSRFANFSTPRYDNIKAGQENGMQTSWIGDGFLQYKRRIGDHQFDLLAGASREFRGTRSTSVTASANDRGSANALNPIPAYINDFRPNVFGAAMLLGNGGFSESTFESFFARFNYSYKDKYILMGAVRRDGSSKFAPDSRWGTFPAVSAAWRISEESFMKKASWINDLKLRASFGISGNDQFGEYAWQGKVNYSNLYTYGPISGGGAGTVNTLNPATIENPALKWETNQQVDFGVDLSAFNNRVNITADYFIRDTKDMLLFRSLPLEMGIASNIFANLGNMTNKGIELAINTVNIKTKDLTWTTTLNFTKINNKVKNVFTKTGTIGYSAGPFGNAIRITEGQSMFQIYTYKVIGIFENQAHVDSYPRANNAVVGDPIIEDTNGDGVINTDDYQHVGNVLPDYTYGLSSSLRFKSFDLSIVIDGSQGASQMVPILREGSLLLPIESNLLKDQYDNRWKPGQSSTSSIWGMPKVSVTGARHF
ncbi:MAG: SusC/RagA family TonB-linked outer membrane protein, partial [Flavitalea sp.]